MLDHGRPDADGIDPEDFDDDLSAVSFAHALPGSPDFGH